MGDHPGNTDVKKPAPGIMPRAGFEGISSSAYDEN
jgi:hypothetical protein